MKTRSTLSERASNIRSDYAPLAAPPNPREDEARSALMDYGAQLLQNKPTTIAHEVGNVLEEEYNREQEQAEHDAILLAAARAVWPAMRLLDTATVGRGLVWDAELQRGVEREGVVVVTVKGVDAE